MYTLMAWLVVPCLVLAVSSVLVSLVFLSFCFLALGVFLAFLAVRSSPSFQPMHSANVSVGYDLTLHSDRTSYPASAMARTSYQKVCVCVCVERSVFFGLGGYGLSRLSAGGAYGCDQHGTSINWLLPLLMHLKYFAIGRLSDKSHISWGHTLMVWPQIRPTTFKSPLRHHGQKLHDPSQQIVYNIFFTS